MATFVGHRDGQNPDPLVEGQGQGAGSGRQVDGMGEEVRVRVGLVGAVRGVAVGSEPGNGRALDEAGGQPGGLGDGAYARWGVRRAPGPGGSRLLPGSPDPVVPLPDVTAPILDGQLDGVTPDIEDFGLVALSRRQEVLST